MEHVNDWCFRDSYKGGLWEEDLHVCALHNSYGFVLRSLLLPVRCLLSVFTFIFNVCFFFFFFCFVLFCFFQLKVFVCLRSCCECLKC